ncbi:MAG: hypothetical protein H3C48_16285 [Chitinophagaceae bacterium]|nr:hypothetical protein [Chitinophagaceae bacterium]
MRNRINYIEFENQLIPFGIFRLSDVLKIYPHFDSRRLNEWQKKGYITKLIKGIYIFNSLRLDESVLFRIANVLVRPSYVSLESALSFYHLIPEQAFSITSITTLKTNSYQTPKGNYHYRSVKNALFFGYKTAPSAPGKFVIAEPEKALLDLLYLRPDLNSKDALTSLRLNSMELAKLDGGKLASYLDLFNNHALNKRYQLFKEVYHAGYI